jgi:hypothetical protein
VIQTKYRIDENGSFLGRCAVLTVRHLKRYLFTDGHDKIRTIKYQTESPKISVEGRGRFGLENRMPIWEDERVWVRIVLECFMFCEGGVPATKSLW